MHSITSISKANLLPKFHDSMISINIYICRPKYLSNRTKHTSALQVIRDIMSYGQVIGDIMYGHSPTSYSYFYVTSMMTDNT